MFMAVRRKNFVSEAVVLQAQSREKTTAAAGEGCSAEDKSCGEFFAKILIRGFEKPQAKTNRYRLWLFCVLDD